MDCARMDVVVELKPLDDLLVDVVVDWHSDIKAETDVHMKASKIDIKTNKNYLNTWNND